MQVNYGLKYITIGFFNNPVMITNIFSTETSISRK